MIISYILDFLAVWSQKGTATKKQPGYSTFRSGSKRQWTEEQTILSTNGCGFLPPDGEKLSHDVLCFCCLHGATIHTYIHTVVGRRANYRSHTFLSFDGSKRYLLLQMLIEITEAASVNQTNGRWFRSGWPVFRIFFFFAKTVAYNKNEVSYKEWPNGCTCCYIIDNFC